MIVIFTTRTTTWYFSHRPKIVGDKVIGISLAIYCDSSCQRHTIHNVANYYNNILWTSPFLIHVDNVDFNANYRSNDYWVMIFYFIIE